MNKDKLNFYRLYVLHFVAAIENLERGPESRNFRETVRVLVKRSDLPVISEFSWPSHTPTNSRFQIAHQLLRTRARRSVLSRSLARNFASRSMGITEQKGVLIV